MKRSAYPPKLFLRFFRWFCHPKLRDHIEGDLMELYDGCLRQFGEKVADGKFVIDVLLLFRPGIVRTAYGYHHSNNYAMFKNYFIVGWRNLLKNKGASFINIGGLAAGMAAAVLIGLWVYDELRFDKNFENYDRIAQVMQNQAFNGKVETWGSQSRLIATELRNTYGSDFKFAIMSSWKGDHKLTFGDKNFLKQGSYMEPGVTEMLSLKMIKGTRAGLNDPHSILLSQSAANAIFGDDEPVEKIIRVDDKLDVKVTGVYEDLPYNCTFWNLTFIAPWQLYISSEDLEARTGWGNSWFQCLAQIADHSSMDEVSAKIKDAKLNAIRLAGDIDDRFKPEIFLHPMSRWHLYSDFSNGMSVGGEIQYVWLFGIVGVFVLLLACINFMNLSTARSEKRAKEVGIRKAIGSARSQLINQFFSESLLIVALAFVACLILVQLALPWFNEVSNKRIVLPWNNPFFWLAGLGFSLITGFISGSFPALYLSSFKPVRVLKGAFRAGRFAGIPRKALVVMQFTISITLIIGTLVVFKQILYAQSRPVGYNYNGLISVPIKTNEIRDHYDAFRNELLAAGTVNGVAASESPVTQTWTTNSGFDWSGKDPDVSEEFATVCVTREFGEVVGWRIRDGRDFSSNMASDTAGFIINEAAAQYMGLEHPVGEIMKWDGNGEWKILGVVRNLVTQSPYSPVKQMIFFLHSERVSFTNYNVINIRINPSSGTGDALADIERVFRKYDPGNAFEYSFVDQEYAKKFKNEKRIGQLASVFATMAIFISCLGLFGLASYLAEQRTKEIGVRKVLGASVSQLWGMLSRDFVVLVIISNAIAIPLSFSFMNNWLMQYEYRTTISWFVFAAAGLGALFIALLTVSYQAIKAAVANPVKSLRSE